MRANASFAASPDPRAGGGRLAPDPLARPIKAIGVLTLSIVLFAGAMHWTQADRTLTAVSARAIAQRSLRFEDNETGPYAGMVTVTDAARGQVIAHIPVGADNFLRATMRGLAQQRLREGLDDRQAFELALFDDGRLSLTDPATGRDIELNAFGPDNRASFAVLLTASAAAAPAAPGDKVTP